MKKTLVLTGAALLLAGPAVAADLAVKAPHYVPGFSWTGCYAGAAIGGARANQSAEMTPTVTLNQGAVGGDLGQGSGAIGGPYVGCNYQFGSGLVLGAEGDFSWTGLSGTFDGPNLFPNGHSAGSGGVTMTSDTRWAASLRARLGFAIMPNALVYGTAGRAFAGTDYTGVDTLNQGSSASTAFSTTGTGWVAGGGVEWAPWSNNWILRAEYLHYEIGGVSSTAVFAPGHLATFTFGDLKIDSVRAGVAYKF